jgi:hypothetical protein
MSEQPESSAVPAPAVAAQPPAAPLPKFSVSEYRPDGGYSVAGVAMLVSAMVLIGALLGFLAHWVSQYFYLIILFPALIGLGLGIVGQKMVKSGRVRSPLIGGLAGFLGGVFAMFMMHYFDYESMKSAIANLPPQVREIAQLPPAERAQRLSPDLTASERADAMEVLKLASVNNMLDYMNLEAERGVQLKGHASSSGDGINLGFYGSYIYWGIEVLIVAFITFAMVKGAAQEPYCAACDRWKNVSHLGYFASDPATASQAVRSGDLNAMRQANATFKSTPLRVSAATCVNCPPGQGAVDLNLESITLDNKGKEQKQTVAHATYPAEAMPYLTSLFSAPGAAAAMPSNV